MNHARQAPPPPPPPPPAGTTTTPSSPPTGSAATSQQPPGVCTPFSSQSAAFNLSLQSGGTSLPSGSLPSGGTTIPVVSAPPTVSFSLHATNPTAVPLASIIANAPSGPTSPLASTPTAGSIPPSISNAPPLPDISGFNPANYPPLDKMPDVNSPQVQQWKQEVMNSGITIPNIAPTVPGGCPANPEAATDASRCWWTCGGCTRESDIESCPDKLHWGMTYDDGPAFYTTQLLNYLDEQSLKTTFFLVGSRVISFPDIARSEYMSGHQIGVHTWSHPPLTTKTNDEVIAELGWARQAIRDVLGVTPNTMRPPYGDIDDRVRAISLALGMIPVMWTRLSPAVAFDTGDFDIQSGLTSASQVILNWQNILNNATMLDHGFLSLQHDLFQDSVDIATGYLLPDAKARGDITIEPVAMCIKRGLSNSYIETNDNKTFPPPQGDGTVTIPGDLPTATNPSATTIGALNASTTGDGSGGSGDNQGSGAIESFHMSGTIVTLTILAGILANMLTVL
ncbi:hypothetical protein AGABI1DRAFT_31623 [Agaricus bisporus var. burnettii JB137-S8]|uniref:chitin deacetylase n=1 Tax=Agaricus bisporus var. burnettii (strain JB137-S8 / ATCC MYA-4627 / FGSC 10392) TaxID=597362 RepID=K5X6G7_AGABU|nr:uncharacterized protein AGABI1DRAFT_31623 [Agaricus bisporus var. burnettii JB137-S8]EKM83476.1 hypothetical protein AGABI1DRAFT_31623 [Agaricus bisporus var. burnettii JB137-S8]